MLKVSIPFVQGMITPEQELVLLATMKMIASGVIPESGLVPGDILSTILHVETWHSTSQIMETNLFQRWITFLSYKK